MSAEVDPVKNFLMGTAAAAIVGVSPAVPIRDANLETGSDVLDSLVDLGASFSDVAENHAEIRKNAEVGDPVEPSVTTELVADDIKDSSMRIEDFMNEFRSNLNEDDMSDSKEKSETIERS